MKRTKQPDERGEPEERRYSEQEFREILAEAARFEEGLGGTPVSWTPSSAQDGITLREIREIARDVLIDPEAVEWAARNLPDHRVIHVSPDKPGAFPRVLQGELLIRRALGLREMRMLTLEAERELDRRGRIQTSADGVQWRDEDERCSVRVERSESATRVSITMDQSTELASGSAVLAAAGVVGTTVLGTTLAGPLLLAAVPLAVGTTIGVVWLNALGRSATTRDRLREVLEQLDEVVRASYPILPATDDE